MVEGEKEEQFVSKPCAIVFFFAPKINLTQAMCASLKDKLMKTRNLLALLSLPIFLNLSGCEKSAVSTEQVDPCPSSATDDLDVTGEFVDVEGQVVRLSSFPDGQFFIQVKYPIQNAAFQRLPLGACNLPEKFQRAGAQIQFSGRLLWYKIPEGSVAIDSSTQPFELTQIAERPIQD